MILRVKLPWLEEASRKKRWLVGVSGGADSVALLHLLVENGFRNLIVCHLDHRLRGRASTEDARFVQRLAVRLGLPFELGREDVAALMKESGGSLETTARQARHQLFAACAEKHRCPRLLLGHHGDDQAETALWNFLRGSYGFKGMSPIQEILTSAGTTLEIHRPLLPVRHSEIVTWLLSRKHAWREDATNKQPVAIRNRLRNEAIPLLSKISGRDVVGALIRGVADATDFAALEDWALEKAAVLDPQGRLHLPVLRELPVPLQRAALRRYLQKHNVGNLDRSLLQRCEVLLEPESAAVVNLPGGLHLRRRNARIFIEEPGVEGI